MPVRTLRDASVLVIGAGGLGAPALLALGARGVGRLGILEPDRVELSNLHRQILYREEDVGWPKVARAAAALRRRFLGVTVVEYERPFEEGTHALVGDYDVVLDGTDSFETKLAISDACVDRGVDYVFAGVVGYEGQVLAVRPGRSACVRCLFDEAPPPGVAPTCSELGILGPVAGMVGARQAEAAVALACGDEGRVAGVVDRLWSYDGRRDRERTIALRRADDCRGCGARRQLRGVGVLEPSVPDALDAPTLDLTELVCPHTYTAARRTLERMTDGGRVWVLLASDEAARNVPRGLVAAGHRILARRSDGRTHRLLLERGDERAADGPADGGSS